MATPSAAAPTQRGGPPSEAAIKARIMNHMNADHADSVLLYLQHYTPYTTATATPHPPQLTDISLAHLTITHYPSQTPIPGGEAVTTTIPITPPMASYAEARVRLVAMAEEAQDALEKRGGGGKSKNTSALGRVTLPNLVGLVISFLVLQTLVFFAPGVVEKVTFPTYTTISTSGALTTKLDTTSSTLYTRTFLLGYTPLIRLLWTYRRVFWGIVVGVHLVEAKILDSRLVGRYGVKRGGGVWAGWIAWAMVEGFGSLVRAEETWREDTGRGGKGGKKV
ncbi:hypothetical protein DFH27DRAFT_359106 [Peziza echinospora]|nr:hypothetical protein DFH27DRAFT_359106 [Peziza echinospora]